MLRYAYFFKSLFLVSLFMLLTACGGGGSATGTSPVQKSLSTIANYSQGASRIPTVADYQNVGATAVTTEDVADINFLVRSLSYDEVNTESEIQAVIQRREEALAWIMAYANSHGTSTPPTIETYRAVGVTGVTDENREAINALIAALVASDVDTGREIDLIVQGYTPPTEDTTPPVITLEGNSTITLSLHTPYTEPGATAIDDVDGVVAVSIRGTIDIHTIGNYVLTYSASDSAGNEANVIRMVQVREDSTPNQAPTATAQSVSTDEDTAIAITLAGTDPEGNILSYTVLSNPSSGVLSGTAPNLTYTPNSNANGNDSFTFKVNDGALDSAEAMVSIVVNPVNDTPVKDSDIPDQSSTDAQTISSLDISTHFSDPDGDSLSFTATNLPTGVSLSTAGVLSGTLAHDASQNSPYTVTVTAKDPSDASVTDSFTWTVANPAPDAVNDGTVAVTEDIAKEINVLGNDSDPDGDTLTVTAVSTPVNGGTVVINASNTITYIPAAGYNGSDSFSYTISDGEGGSDTATVSVDVGAVNDTPVKDSDIPDQSSTDAQTISSLDISTHFSDPDGDSLSFTATNLPTGVSLSTAGVLSGTLAHDASQNSPYTVTVTAKDPSDASVTDSFTWTVANPAPDAVNDGTVAVTEDIAKEINVLGNDSDPDGDTLTVTAVSTPVNGGTVVINASNTITYIPAAGYNGSDSFSYTISDGEGGSDTATVSVEVNARARDYYVSLSGDDSNDGESEATAWRTIAYAASHVRGGDRVHIKAGNYGNENITIDQDGNATDPIVFEGYRETVGDISPSTFVLGDELNTSKMPLLDGGDRTHGDAITITNHAYITLKNIQITRYENAIPVYGSHHIVLDNMVLTTFGALGASGGSVYSGTAITLNQVNDSNISHVTIINANAEALSFSGDRNILDAIRVYSDEVNESMGADGTDYYIVGQGNDNQIKNSYIERIVPDVNYTDPSYPHVGHGIGFKDASEHNLVENCTAKNAENNFYVRFGNVKNNTFRNCTALGADFVYTKYTNHGSFGFVVRNGAEHNLFDSCVSDGNTYGVSFHRSAPEETWDDSTHAGKDNIFVNTLFINTLNTVIDMNPYSSSEPDDDVIGNQFINCTIDNAPYLISARRPNSGNSMTNTIISNVATLENPNSTHAIDFTYRYSDFYGGFTMPVGVGNIDTNPRFVDSSAGDYHLQGSSAAVDSGEATITEANHDREGIARPRGGAWDMGVYESAYTTPTADAGVDIIAGAGATVTLDGSGSIDDGSIISYTWSEGGSVIGTGVTLDKSDFSVGEHRITLVVKDNLNATDSDEVMVTIDDEAPVIVMNGAELIRVVLNDSYDDPGATATDDRDMNVTVTVISNVDTSQVGNYTVTYHAVDSAGNHAESKVRRVEVVDSVPVSVLESFDNENPVTYWTRSGGMAKPTLTVNYDSANKTEGSTSLHLQTHIDGLADANAQWYYYLQIPISPALNVEGQLAFSADVMVDSATAGHVRLGYNKQYHPINKSGVRLFEYINESDQWVTVENSDVSALVRSRLDSSAKTWLYDGHANDIGATIDRIGIYIFGKGPLDLDMRLDNLRLDGTQTEPSTFYNNVNQRWASYIARVKVDLDDRNSTYAQMSSEVNTTGETLCSKQQNLSDKLDSDKTEIEALLDYMYDKNSNNTYFPQEKMDDLDTYMSDYEMTYPRLVDSLGADPTVDIYRFPAMEYHRLNGYDMPKLEKATAYNIRMAKGEYRSIAMLLDPMCASGTDFTVENTVFASDTHTLPAAIMDTYIAKIWYQAGLTNTGRTGKYIMQELLLKDENLVQVDFAAETNALRITDNDTNTTHYIDITAADASFPDTTTITVADAAVLQPFALDEIRYKLVWSIIHIPEDAVEGNYTATFSLKNESDEIVAQVPISIEVLPFELNASRLAYSLYYTGKLVDAPSPLKGRVKSQAQQLIELIDMKEHGVLYPTSYESSGQLANTLDLRNDAGLPTDRFYSLGIGPFTGSTHLTDDVDYYQSVLLDKGYDPNELYCYAIDEAGEAQLEAEKEDIDEIHAAGGKVFVAGYSFTHDHLGDYLDLFNYAYGTVSSDSLEQVQQWHDSGKQIFTYAAPQVGVENPEIYRRNFGCKLWQQGYDGGMDWAYQYERGAFWNDFDGGSTYREETFTYPTTNGIVGTIEWEGYRDAITDVRYISTLLDIRDTREAAGEDVIQLNNFIQSIDCDGDLYKLREDIIDQIKLYR